MKISLGQKRFLIIWCLFHLFALATSVIPIKGEILIEEDGMKYTNYIFTDKWDVEGKFWPFVEMYDPNGYNTYNRFIEQRVQKGEFKGIFRNYNIGAFFVYIVLGLLIVFLPKLWSNK
jgi:hypothetical protein